MTADIPEYLLFELSLDSMLTLPVSTGGILNHFKSIKAEKVYIVDSKGPLGDTLEECESELLLICCSNITCDKPLENFSCKNVKIYDAEVDFKNFINIKGLSAQFDAAKNTQTFNLDGMKFDKLYFCTDDYNAARGGFGPYAKFVIKGNYSVDNIVTYHSYIDGNIPSKIKKLTDKSNYMNVHHFKDIGELVYISECEGRGSEKMLSLIEDNKVKIDKVITLLDKEIDFDDFLSRIQAGNAWAHVIRNTDDNSVAKWDPVDVDGEVVDRWIADNKSNYIIRSLKIDQSYAIVPKDSLIPIAYYDGPYKKLYTDDQEIRSSIAKLI